MAVTSWMAAWLWGSPPSFTPFGACRGGARLHCTPLALSTGTAVLQKPQRQHRGPPEFPPATGQPPTAGLPDGRMTNQVVRGCVESAAHSGTSHSPWALQALPWTPAAMCAWQVHLVPPQPLPLLQGGLLEGGHSRTHLRHLP